MQTLVNIFCFVLLPSFIAGQTPKKQERERFFVVPSAVAAPVVAYQAECPIEFLKASILYHVGGGGVETFQIRNRGNKPIRAYAIATVTSAGSGARWGFEATKAADWFMPNQVLSPSNENSIEVVPVTHDLHGPMKGITVFMVVRVEYSDGAIYAAEAEYEALRDFFERNRILPH